MAVVSGVAFNVSLPRRYESTVRLRVGPAVKDDSARFSDLVGDQASPRTLADLATSPQVLHAVITRLGLATDAGQLARNVKVRLLMQSGLLDVTVGGLDPEAVAATAEAIGQELAARGTAASAPALEAFRATIQRDIEASIEHSRRAEAQLAQIDRQIAARPASDPGLEREVARQQVLAGDVADWQRGRTHLYEVMLKAGLGDPVTIVGPARVPADPVTPPLTTTLSFAAALGLGLGATGALGLDWLERGDGARGGRSSDRRGSAVEPPCNTKAFGDP